MKAAGGMEEAKDRMGEGVEGVRMSDIRATEMSLTVMGVVPFPQPPDNFGHPWYGYSFSGLRAIGKVCAFEHSAGLGLSGSVSERTWRGLCHGPDFQAHFQTFLLTLLCNIKLN